MKGTIKEASGKGGFRGGQGRSSGPTETSQAKEGQRGCPRSFRVRPGIDRRIARANVDRAAINVRPEAAKRHQRIRAGCAGLNRWSESSTASPGEKL